MHLATSHPARRRTLGLFVCMTLAALALPISAWCTPTVGFLEEWSGGSLNGWGGSFDMTYSNPNAGGVLGSTDGYLLLSKLPPKGHFGTRSTGTEYTGDWTGAGVTQIRLWLNDVNTDEAFSIHVAIGQFDDLWQYNQSFLPPNNLWGEFTVDLTDSTKFSHTIVTSGKGFAWALQHVDVLHIRHDLAPYVQLPDSIFGDLGIDHLLLTNGIVGVGSGPAGGVHPVDLAPPFPNPSRGAVAMSVQNRDGGEVRFQVVDVQGRVVRSATLAAHGAGPGLWMWDGLDAHGHRVPPGAYRVRATSASGGTTRPLIRVE